MVLRSRQPGFILIFTVMMLAVGVTLIGAVALRVYTASKEQRFIIAREQARLVALSGVELVRSRLSNKDTKVAQKDNPAWLLEQQDRWLAFPVPGDESNADDMLLLRIQVEDGKINLNSFFDAQKKRFVFPKIPATGTSIGAAFFSAFNEQVKQFGIENFYEVVQGVLKERKDPLVDFSELFMHIELKKYRIPLFPSFPTRSENGQFFAPIALSDFFLMAPLPVENGPHIWPLHMSCPILKLFQLECWPVGHEARVALVQELIKKIGQKAVNWERQWNDLVGKLYKKNWNDLGKLGSDAGTVMMPSSGASLVSVVSYGNVSGVKQGVYAVLRFYQGVDSSHVYTVTRLYWI